MRERQNLLWGILLSLSLAFTIEATALKAAFLPAQEAPALNEALAASLNTTGYEVDRVSFDSLSETEALDGYDLFFLADAARLPIEARLSITAFLERGGDLFALNAPLWQEELIRGEAGWQDKKAYRKAQSASLMGATLFDFENESLEGWTRTSNVMDRQSAARISAIQDGPAAKVLEVDVPVLDNWDTLASPPLSAPFPEGHCLTVFWAKGAGKTTALSIEWREEDGSRWIASVPLSEKWRQYVLAPADFHYWDSVSARAKTQFNPAKATQMTVGLALSHTPLPAGPHRFFLGPVGTAARTPIHEKLLHSFSLPAWELMTPGHKFFPITQAIGLQWALSGKEMALPDTAMLNSTHPRPMAGGFDKKRNWRWQPLLRAYNESGEWCGTPAAFRVHAEGPFQGGVWASFAISDLNWYAQAEVQEAISQMLRRMRRGIFMMEGGAHHYTYFEDQEVTLGARAVSVAQQDSGALQAVITLRDGDNVVREERFGFALKPGEDTAVSTSFAPETWPEAGYTVTTTLYEDETEIDAARHSIHVWKPKAEASYVTVKNGDFQLDEKRWRVHGVNYMPSSGIAVDDSAYFEFWLGADAYDPQIIDLDLQRIKKMGMNAVSIFIYHRSLPAQNLLDLLRRLENYGLKANLSLRPGTPMDFEWEKIRELIRYFRIAENDTVFALDLAWEPMFREHASRKRWDPFWHAWIVERYGSVLEAEKDWGFPAPRDEAGALTNPDGKMLVEDGAWRVMVAAYRRFLDTLVYKYYQRARSLVREEDPHHLVSFRMAEAGNPEFRWDKAIPYDWPYLSKAVDLLEPEAYGRVGDWKKVRPGLFEFEYARCVAPELPMLWAEAGTSAWVPSSNRVTEERLAFQGDYFENLYRMFIQSAADGVFFWWYPGGYRTNEKSDYGIINSDGSDRPATKVIRDSGGRFLEGPNAKKIDSWIEIDRDPHPHGLRGIYDEVGDAFWQALEEGKTPGLRSAGAGTTSFNCPALAVGNVPWTGRNPAKYLDIAFDQVELRDATGNWIPVEKGATVVIDGAAPVPVRITLVNLGEATLMPPDGRGKAGGVVLHVGDELDLSLPRALANGDRLTMNAVTPPPGEDFKERPMRIWIEAQGRGVFGERWQVFLKYK